MVWLSRLPTYGTYDHYCCSGSYKITFLPLQSIKEMAKKARFNKLFDIAYFSNRYNIEE